MLQQQTDEIIKSALDPISPRFHQIPYPSTVVIEKKNSDKTKTTHYIDKQDNTDSPAADDSNCIDFRIGCSSQENICSKGKSFQCFER